MFYKIKLSEIFTNLQTRFFNTTSMSGRASKIVQFHSGGDDYCPLKENEGLSENIGDNPADGFVFAWRDDVLRTAKEGEKRIYSIKVDTETNKPVLDENGLMTVAAEVHLKNDGKIVISGGSDLNLTVVGNANIKAAAATIEAETVNLGGEGGALVLTENSTITDSQGGTCSIVSNTKTTKAV